MESCQNADGISSSHDSPIEMRVMCLLVCLSRLKYLNEAIFDLVKKHWFTVDADD